MSSSKPSRPAVRWPFWLLLAAWFCANSPQAGTYEAIVWLRDARHFSHQQRLTQEVATVLGGAQVRSTVTSRDAAERPALPAVPVEATLKKTDLALVISSELILPAQPRRIFRAWAFVLPVSPWSEPPAEPPRAA